MLIQHVSMRRTVLYKELCWAGGCLSDLASFYFSPGPLYSYHTSCLLSPQTRTMLLFHLCWLFALPRILFPQIHSWTPPSLPSGLLLRDWLRSLQKTQHPVPLLFFLTFLHSTRHRWTFYTCSFVHCAPLGKVSSHPRGSACLAPPAWLLPQHFGQCLTQGRCWHYLLIPCWVRMKGRPLRTGEWHGHTWKPIPQLHQDHPIKGLQRFSARCQS